MCFANLLINLESFAWNDLTIDRSSDMENLILAVDEAINHEDQIFGHPDCFNYKIEHCFFHDILYFDEEERQVFTNNWLSNDYQKALIKLWRSPTPKLSKNILEMDLEPGFIGANNGMIGCSEELLLDRYVSDILSWTNLHKNYVKSNISLHLNCPEYFKRFYIPSLTVSANQINYQIKQSVFHSLFDRIDIPKESSGEGKLHGEQIHIHFYDSKLSALNIDGTWKHGGFILPVDVEEQLIEWGFLLPTGAQAVLSLP